MSKKKKGNVFLKILAFFFIIYMALFIANMSGYYETKIRDKVVVTENSIKEFEEKLQNGEEIDVSSFLKTETVDYSSTMSKIGDSFTNTVEGFAEKSMKLVSSILRSLF